MKNPPALAAAVLLLVGMHAATSDQSGKPSASSQTGAGVPGNTGSLVARPDLKVTLDGQFLVVSNIGAADWTGPVDVTGTCKSNASGASSEACGASFPNGHFGYHMASLLPGHGASVIPAPPAVSGPGWRAIKLDLPGGTFNVSFAVDPQAKVPDANRANNTLTQTVTIANFPPAAPRRAN